MADPRPHPDLTGHRVLVPGGTGAVGEGVVRNMLRAGADVVVPTRSTQRSTEFRHVLGDAADERLHLVVHDYTTFDGAQSLVAEVRSRLGALDHVVAPIGGWWAGGPLRSVSEADWSTAFTGLATTHMAVLRAALPVLSDRGSYVVVVGDSALFPVPDSGLVSMEQAAVLMMQRVAAAESERRVFALLLGPVSTRVSPGQPDWVTADQVGRVTTTIAAHPSFSGQTVALHGLDEVEAAEAAARGARL